MDIFLNTAPFNIEAKCFCLQLLGLVLTNIFFFLFGDEMYLHQLGTTMGSNIVPPYANIRMSVFEDKHIYSHDFFKIHILIWLRYIDDIFGIGSGPINTLLAFHQYLNTINSELQFILHHDPYQIKFQDTFVIKNTDEYQ